MRRIRIALLFCVAASQGLGAAVAQNDPSKQKPAASDLREQANGALQQVIAFYDGKLSVKGGYVWQYAADLSAREGEKPVNESTAWVQPPGTPFVGLAWLNAYRRCQHPELLAAARRTAGALVQGQLVSGGWDYQILFDPKQREQYAYRVDEPRPKARNTTTLDDNTTQSALRFLMEIDLELQFKDAAIHGAVEYALDKLIDAQYPNGAWPQRFSGPPERDQFPVKRASLPESWPRKYPGDKYFANYTFNDDSQADLIQVLLLAADIYGQDRYRQAAFRGGDFILQAQLPEPQPAWAQQYNVQMQPSWARKFEPPSVTGGESQEILRLLMVLYRESGDKKFLAPIEPAIAYLRRSLLADGRLARFYELGSNRPLYLVRDTYELTYDDSNLPTHYGFKVSSKLDQLEADYRRVRAMKPQELKRNIERPAPSRGRASSELQAQAAQVIKALDSRGAWVEPGELRSSPADGAQQVIVMKSFAKNLEVLARYLGTRP